MCSIILTLYVFDHWISGISANLFTCTLALLRSCALALLHFCTLALSCFRASALLSTLVPVSLRSLAFTFWCSFDLTQHNIASKLSCSSTLTLTGSQTHAHSIQIYFHVSHTIVSACERFYTFMIFRSFVALHTAYGKLQILINAKCFMCITHAGLDC